MSTIPAFQSGLLGIQSGMQNLNRNMNTIANNDNGDLTEPLIDMMRNKHQVQASAKVIETSQNMIGSLLDITV